MSPNTRALLDLHVEAIRRWHWAKLQGDQHGEDSVLIAQGQVKATGWAFAVSDAADRRREAGTLTTPAPEP